MEELSNGDWSLIARYLYEEASQKDMVSLTTLAHRTQNLRMEIERLGQGMNAQASPRPVFHADPAFDKLHRRLVAEGLI